MRSRSTYLEARNRELRAQGITRIPEEKLAEWRSNPPAPDPDATYAARIVLDLAEVTPHVSGPDTVQVMQSVAEIAKKKVAIQKAYLVSCVNSRLEDLEAAAKVLRGKKVADRVQFYLAAASRSVQQEAERSAASGRRCSMPARILCLRAADPASALAQGLLEAGRSRNFRDQSQLQRPHGFARCAVLSGESRRWSRLRPLPATSADPRNSHRRGNATLRGIRHATAAPQRKWRSFPDFPPAFADDWSSCRRTT